MAAWFKKSPVPDPSESPKTPQLKGSAAPAPKAKGVKISQILTTDAILIAPAGLGKDGLLETMVKRLCELKGLPDPAAFLAKVQEREQGISTTLDTGLSLPHARMDAVPTIVAAMGIVPKGIPDPKQPDLTIRLMFLFFSPNKQESFPLHLQLLRGVSSLFQPAVIDQLTAAPTAEAALALIRKVEA